MIPAATRDFPELNLVEVEDRLREILTDYTDVRLGLVDLLYDIHKFNTARSASYRPRDINGRPRRIPIGEVKD